MVGPFFITPSLVTTTLMAYAAHHQFGRMRVVAVILGAAIAIPWALELFGVVDSTYRFAHGEIILSSSIVTFSAVPVQIAFGLLLLVLLTVVSVLSRTMAKRQRDATHKLELQAWHLRQIVPTQAA
jgi:serine/threonine-protein kinase